MKKIFTSIVFLLTLFSCGSGSQDTNKVFKLNLSQEGETLDSTLLTDVTGGNIHSLISEGLLKLEPSTGQFVAGLAKSYEVSENGLEYVFHLRDDIKYNDGTPITAHDFEFSWKRSLDPNTAASYAYLLYPIKNAQQANEGKVSLDEVGVKAIDDKTLKVELNSPTAYFKSLLILPSYMPINKSYLEKMGDQYALEADSILSSGPFYIKSWDHNSSMTFEKNPNYYDPKAYDIEKIEAKFISDNSASLNAYKNEELDFIKLTASQLDEFKDSKELMYKGDATVWYLEPNFQKPFLANNNIRQAIMMAIDKEGLVETVHKNVNTPHYSLTPKGVGMKGLEKDFVEEMGGGKVVHYNPEKSKELFALGLKELGLEKSPKISLILNDSGSNKKTGEYIQENLRVNLGLEVEIEVMTFKERLQRTKNGTFDLILAGWGADYQDPMTFLDLFVTNGGNNHGKYSNSEYDELIKFAQTTVDEKARIDALHKVEDIIAKELPILPLFQVRSLFIAKPRVEGIHLSSFGPEYILKDAKIK